VGHVACMGEMRNAYITLFRKLDMVGVCSMHGRDEK
jgi:hypothetical protein